MAILSPDLYALLGLCCSVALTVAWAPVALTCDILLLVLERGMAIPPPISTAMAFVGGHAIFVCAAASQVYVEGSAAAAAGLYSQGSVPLICSTSIELSHSLSSAVCCLSQSLLIAALSSLVLLSRSLAILLSLAIQYPKLFYFFLLLSLGIWGRATA